jgi:hypothetical protein
VPQPVWTARRGPDWRSFATVVNVIQSTDGRVPIPLAGAAARSGRTRIVAVIGQADRLR